MPVLTVRLSDELHAAVKAQGGSPWVRTLLERELALVVVSAPVTVAERVMTELADNGKGNMSHAVTPVEKLCPRWMHHREGEFCKTCGQ